MTHADLVRLAERAINRVHEDRSIAIEQTAESLQFLQEHLEELLSGIEEDIAYKKGELK